MTIQTHTLTIRLSQPDGVTYRLDLTSPDVGEGRRCAFRARELYPAPRARHLGQGMSNTTIEFYQQQLFIAREIGDRRTKITDMLGEQVLVTHKV